MLLKLLLLTVLVAGALLMFRLRLRSGLLLGLLVLPMILIGAAGSMFMAAFYLIVASVILCVLLLLYIVVKALAR